jgi:DNA-binding response OmpR family regulator
MKPRVLVVEDEVTISEPLAQHLGREGFDAEVASTIEAATKAWGALRLDPSSRTLTKDGEPIELAAKEFDLLHLLMANAGDVMRRETIMDEVWDPHWFGPTKTLDVHISWLRKKIEDDPSEPRFIATIRGVGFRFAAPQDMATDPT